MGRRDGRGEESENKIFKKNNASAGSWTDVYLSAMTYVIFNHILLLKTGHMIIPRCKGRLGYVVPGWGTISPYNFILWAMMGLATLNHR